MATTVEELMKRYESDPQIRKEVAELIEQGKTSILEFRALAKRHGVNISLLEIPHLISEAKRLGIIPKSYE